MIGSVDSGYSGIVRPAHPTDPMDSTDEVNAALVESSWKACTRELLNPATEQPQGARMSTCCST